jgi:hypothetical protein
VVSGLRSDEERGATREDTTSRSALERAGSAAGKEGASA